jgi:hypothetical protein
MLKQQPKKLWGMIKSRTSQPAELSLEAFSDFNKEVFYDEKIPPDQFKALNDATT